MGRLARQGRLRLAPDAQVLGSDLDLRERGQRCYGHFLRNALDDVPRRVDDGCLREVRWLSGRRGQGWPCSALEVHRLDSGPGRVSS